MDYGRFTEFWSQQLNCMIGLYETKDPLKKLIGIVGIYSIQYPERCELKRMWICEEHRRNGLGKVLLNSILNEARKLNYKRVQLVTVFVLKDAIEFYLKNDFKLTKELRFSAVLPFNYFYELHLEKEL